MRDAVGVVECCAHYPAAAMVMVEVANEIFVEENGGKRYPQDRSCHK